MERLLLGTLAGCAAGLVIGVLLPLRWSLSLAGLATVAFMGYLLTHVQDRPEIIMEYFLIFFIFLPQLVLPVWAGVGAGYGIRRWSSSRLAPRLLATAGVMIGLYGLYELAMVEPRWKAGVEEDGATFVKAQRDVAARAGSIQGANVLGAIRVTGAELPYSQIDYFVRGDKANLVVKVGVTGRRGAPAFHIVSIQRSP